MKSMKALIVFTLLAPTLILGAEPMLAKVYITNSGTKYHRLGCRYLRKSSLDIELDAAKKAGYTPCKVCKP